MSEKVTRNQKSWTRLFSTLHSNKLKSKITAKLCGLLELKLKVGVKMYKM